MIGLGGSGGGEGSVSGILDVLTDDSKYGDKLKELLKQVDEAKKNQTIAVEALNKAQNERRVAEDIMAKANVRAEDAQRDKAEATRLIENVAYREQQLTADRTKLEQDRRDFDTAKITEMDAARKKARAEANAALQGELTAKRVAADAAVEKALDDAKRQAASIVQAANQRGAEAEAQARLVDQQRQESEQIRDRLKAKAEQMSKLMSDVK